MPESFRGGCSFGTGGHQILPALTRATLLHRAKAGKGLCSALWRGIRGCMKNQFIFGYGSLVNRATHDYETALPARLSGWKRVWRHTALRPVAFLTAEPEAACEIDGLIVRVAHGNPELEQREHAYDRADVTPHIHHDHPDPAHVHTYTIGEGKHEPATEDHPVLLSYLDVVVQGYLREYGQAGVRHFFETTDGWDAPILNDRAEPVYGRHQKLTRDEAELADSWLAKLSAVVKQR